ncbi:MAG: DNA-directed RNA polymerase subunit omega [Lachnospiraceae bacterium]|jgi:DNA-directed RNA polymerase subunit omega|nr:DNA-directed RNA polymerase subunit omega [Lachnospiraceae bacterium]
MLRPSYSDLIEAVNSDIEPGEQPVVQSRYSIVIAASKRARQLIDGAEPLVGGSYRKKALSVSVDELYKGKVKLLGEEEAEETNVLDETAEEEPAADPDGAPAGQSEPASKELENGYEEESETAGE